MTDGNSSDYYLRRADRQARLAHAATTTGVRQIHDELAERYRALAATVGGGSSRIPTRAA